MTPPTQPPQTLFSRLALPIIMAISGLLLALMINPFLTIVNHDSAIFCILAQSILKGHYLLVSEPNPQPYFTFPPLLPLQLAALMKIFNTTNIQTMQWVFKGYIHLLFWLSLPVFFAWSKSLFNNRRDAIILTALLAINPIIFKYSSDILSDTPYWAFSMFAIYGLWKLTQDSQVSQGKKSRHTIIWFTLTLLLVIACALLRQIGLALVLTFLLALVLRRSWKLLLLAASTIALTVGGWQSFEHFYRLNHRSDISSLNQQGVQAILDRSPIKLEYVKHFLVDRPVDMDQNRFQTSPAILAGNIRDRIIAYSNFSLDQLLPRMQFRYQGKKLNITHHILFQCLFWVLFIIGSLALWKKFKALPLYIAIYMGVLLVYPYISIRFILPVYPFIQLTIYLGILQLFAHKQKTGISKPCKIAIGLFTLLALTGQIPTMARWVNAGYQLKVANQGPSLRRGNSAYYRTMRWLKNNTPANSLIISRKPPVVFFYSHRHSTAFPFTSDEKKLFDYIKHKQLAYHDQFPFIYIFEDQVFGSSKRYLTPMVNQYRETLQLVYTEPQTQSRIWLLKPDSKKPL